MDKNLLYSLQAELSHRHVEDQLQDTRKWKDQHERSICAWPGFFTVSYRVQVRCVVVIVSQADLHGKYEASHLVKQKVCNGFAKSCLSGISNVATGTDQALRHAIQSHSDRYIPCPGLDAGGLADFGSRVPGDIVDEAAGSFNDQPS